MTLFLGTAALLLGPILYVFGQRFAILQRVFSALIVLTIALIIAVHIVPEALQHGGALAAVVIVSGIVFPLLLERLFRQATDTAHAFIVALAALGLLIHAVIDGIALLPESGTGLAHAIILHRIPVGMALWWALRPTYGLGITALTFGLICISTTAGYFVGEPLLAMAETKTIALLQAFVAGSLIHVVLFGVKHDHSH